LLIENNSNNRAIEKNKKQLKQLKQLGL